jgi:hypothetical protein
MSENYGKMRRFLYKGGSGYIPQISIITFGILALVGWGLYIGLELYWAQTMPLVPLPELGRIYPLNVHGTIVYLTEQQDLLLKWILVSSVVLFGIGAFLNLIFKKY